MSTQLLLQSATFGILVGGLYGMAALGLALAFGVLKVLNIAHGELIMIGGYASFYAATQLGLDPFLSLPLVFVVLVAIGFILHLVVFRYVVRFDTEHRIKNSLLIAFGLVLILQATAVRLFTADERATNVSYGSDGFSIGTIRIPYVRLGGLLVAIAAVLLLEWWLRRTTFGRAIRATSEDWSLATLTGIDVRKVYLVAFGIAAGLAGITGTMVTLSSSVSPSIGLNWTLKALIVVVLAGLGSIRGTVIAGVLLGLVEGLATATPWVGAPYREVVGLVVFLLVLSLRPQGLFGDASA
jgi:branched-chain amino acid transport system permease protein